MLHEIWEALAPNLIDAIMSLVALATGYGVLLVRRWTGIQIEARYREALHQAIRTGVVAALEGKLRGDALVDTVRRYVAQSVPDALRHLAPGEGVLATLIRAKAAEAIAGALR